MPHLIGVTGTNGKTSTSRFLACALAAWCGGEARVACFDSLAWRVGAGELGAARDEGALLAGLELLEAAGGAAAVVELTSHGLALGFGRSVRFDVGVFTNLTQEHLELHQTFERYLACKAQLFMRLSAGACAVVNARDPACRLLEGVLAPGVNVRRYGVASRGQAYCGADVEARAVRVDRAGTRAKLIWSASERSAPSILRIRALGEVFVENALAAMLAAHAVGVPLGIAGEAIAACEPPPGRFMRVSTSPDVYVDVAHSPDALARTLTTARALAQQNGGRVLLVFGSGGQRDVEKRAQMGRAAAATDFAVVTADGAHGDHPRDVALGIASGMPAGQRACIELDRLRAIELVLSLARPEDVVLIAGRGPLGAPTLDGPGLPSDAALVSAVRYEMGP